MATEAFWNSRRQFGGGGDWESQQDSQSEHYFPEPISPEQRLRLPDIHSQETGIHVGGRRGRLVMFYRNGDPHFKGLSASISQKAFISMESLLTWLSEKIPTTAGVRHVLRLPDGRQVRHVTDFEPGGHYAVSSVRQLVRGIDYGGGGGVGGGLGGDSNRPWLTEARDPSAVAGRMRTSDIRLLGKVGRGGGVDAGGRRMRMRQNGHLQAASNVVSPDGGGYFGARQRATGARLITVVSNTHRSSREKVLLNPATRLGFEDLLADFASLLVMSGPPVRALYTAAPPYRRVESFSQLFREFRDFDTFIACGRELTPVELVGVGGGGGGGSGSSRDAGSPGKFPPSSRLANSEDWRRPMG